jgi:biopolymer transport protein ExbD
MSRPWSIFIVTARFTLPSNIKVDLPEAASGEAASGESRPTVVTLKPAGEIFFNDQSSSLEQLPAQLAELHKTSASAQLVINADEKVLHGAVVHVLDLAKRTGIEKVAISIEEPQ